MKIGIASDHGGYEEKKFIMSYLKSSGYEVIDYGPYELDMSDDYPIFAFKLCENISNIDIGILLCRSGIGMAIAANKVKGVRCAKVDNVIDARTSRSHNYANVISLNSSLDENILLETIKAFIKTPFSDEERHARRVKLIDEYDNKF